MSHLHKLEGMHQTKERVSRQLGGIVLDGVVIVLNFVILREVDLYSVIADNLNFKIPPIINFLTVNITKILKLLPLSKKIVNFCLVLT